MQDPPLQPFSVGAIRTGEGRVRVEVDGELDLATAPRLVWLLRDQVSAGHDVLLDLSGVSFIDNAGLRALISGSRIARSGGRQLTIGPLLAHQPRRMLEITHLEDLLADQG